MTSKSSHHHRVVHVFFPDGHRGWLPKCLSPGKWNKVTKWVGGGTTHSRYGVFKLHSSHPKNGANIMIGKFYNCTNGMWILDGMGNTKTIFQPGSFETSMKPEERWFPRISIQPFPLSWLWEKEIERVNNAAMSRKNFRAWICLVRCLEKVKHRNSINDGLLECPWS